MKRITIILVVPAFVVLSASGQGFLNLNFESVQNLTNNPGNGMLVFVTNALPNWTAYDGSLTLSRVYYASNVIFGTAASVGLDGGSLALSGNWSAELYDGGSISQTGLVPGNAESLQFEAQGPGGGGSLGASGFAVTLGGQSLSFSALTVDADYTVYGANIPADMDGQMEALTFLCQGIGSGDVRLDDIEFSTTGIPEPSECGLIGLGAILFGLCRRRKSQR